MNQVDQKVASPTVRTPPPETPLDELCQRFGQRDPDLASARDPHAPCNLPEAERESRRKMWADVGTLLEQTRSP